MHAQQQEISNEASKIVEQVERANGDERFFFVGNSTLLAGDLVLSQSLYDGKMATATTGPKTPENFV
jgi:hypothetical protein